MTSKSCFVIMPIRKPGTPEHAHFKAIFNRMRPTLEAEGFTVLRADDVKTAGAITKDIVARLADSDLVVADLTDLNANVFYELGVRHALRGTGTIMVIDDKRTVDIPFDLSAYRVIKYTGDLEGIEALTSSLAAFLKEAPGTDASWRDNPVHDWFPMLPMNVLDTASHSSEAPLRRTIKDLQDRIDQYEKAFGKSLPGRSFVDTPLSAVLAALSDAEDGLLPVNVLEEARRAFDTRDALAFLKMTRKVLERNVRLPANAFMALAGYADVLDLDTVRRALFEQALQYYPSDTSLKRSYLMMLAHSHSPSDRERARTQIPLELSFEISGDTIAVGHSERLDKDLVLISILLDAYHRDHLYSEAMRLTEKLVELLPNNSRVLRNYGRALEYSGQPDKAIAHYRAAIFAPDVDDTSVIWLGNELHNRGKYRDSAEAYVHACLLDPTDANNFSHLTDALAICLERRDFETDQVSLNTKLDGVTVSDVVDVAHCAASCPNVDSEASERIRRAFERLDTPLQRWETPLSKTERAAVLKKLYVKVRTDLTTPGAAYKFTSHQSVGANHADAAT